MRPNKILLVSLTILVAPVIATNLANSQGGGGGGGAPPAQGGQGGPQGAGQRAPGGFPPPLRLVSTDIADGKPIAAKFTCAGGPKTVSPGLQWMQGPRGTISFALIMHALEPRPQKGGDVYLAGMG